MRNASWTSIRIWLFWAALAVPLIGLVADKLINHTPGGRIFYWTGAISAILILTSLSITPLTRMFPGAPWVRWLLRRRRYIGVAGFAYAAAHLAYWMQAAGMHRVLTSVFEPVILLGWVSFAIFAAMAITSNNFSVRRMGPAWKKLQRWVYLAMPIALLHWFMAEGYKLKTMLIYGGVFLVLMGMRVVMTARPRTSTRLK